MCIFLAVFRVNCLVFRGSVLLDRLRNLMFSGSAIPQRIVDSTKSKRSPGNLALHADGTLLIKLEELADPVPLAYANMYLASCGPPDRVLNHTPACEAPSFSTTGVTCAAVNAEMRKSAKGSSSGFVEAVVVTGHTGLRTRLVGDPTDERLYVICTLVESSSQKPSVKGPTAHIIQGDADIDKAYWQLVVVQGQPPVSWLSGTFIDNRRPAARQVWRGSYVYIGRTRTSQAPIRTGTDWTHAQFSEIGYFPWRGPDMSKQDIQERYADYVDKSQADLCMGLGASGQTYIIFDSGLISAYELREQRMVWFSASVDLAKGRLPPKRPSASKGMGPGTIAKLPPGPEKPKRPKQGGSGTTKEVADANVTLSDMKWDEIVPLAVPDTRAGAGDIVWDEDVTEKPQDNPDSQDASRDIVWDDATARPQINPGSQDVSLDIVPDDTNANPGPVQDEDEAVSPEDE